MTRPMFRCGKYNPDNLQCSPGVCYYARPHFHGGDKPIKLSDSDVGHCDLLDSNTMCALFTSGCNFEDCP